MEADYVDCNVALPGTLRRIFFDPGAFDVGSLGNVFEMDVGDFLRSFDEVLFGDIG